MKRSAEQERMWRLAGRFSAVGIEIAVAVTLPTLVGLWIDGRFGTSYAIFIGLVIGVGAATRTIMRVMRTKLDKL